MTSPETPHRQPVLRFAPSPNGELHLGHALSALVTYETAQRLGGRFLLRIEDIDPVRSRRVWIDGIFRDLEWLGLCWETPVLQQSEHLADYRTAAAHLEAMGLLYPCFASRAEILALTRDGPSDPDGAPLYPGLHRRLPRDEVDRRKRAGAPHVIRLNMAAAVEIARARLGGAPLGFTERATRVTADPARWGDVVLQRKDTPTSYHLSVVVDDARQGITHVTRGLDLLAATDLHRLLQVLLEHPEPVYAHHRLMTDAGGRKLAKSARDTSLRHLRETGATPSQVRRLVDLDRALHDMAALT